MSSTSKICPPPPPAPVQPPAIPPPADDMFRERMISILKTIIRLTWISAILSIPMFLSTTNRDLSNKCDRIFGGKNLAIAMQALCFESLLLSAVAAHALKLFLDRSSPGAAEKMRGRIRLGVGACLISSWLGLFAVIMLLQVTAANTLDCGSKARYGFSVGVISFTHLCVLFFYCTIRI